MLAFCPLTDPAGYNDLHEQMPSRYRVHIQKSWNQTYNNNQLHYVKQTQHEHNYNFSSSQTANYLIAINFVNDAWTLIQKPYL